VEGYPDLLVRKEAVLLRRDGGRRRHAGWLEERFLADDSDCVRAAALGAMVVQARYPEIAMRRAATRRVSR
jgi:hypothetical protein